MNCEESLKLLIQGDDEDDMTDIQALKQIEDSDRAAERYLQNPITLRRKNNG
jgi:HKD family nuclease